MSLYKIAHSAAFSDLGMSLTEQKGDYYEHTYHGRRT